MTHVSDEFLSALLDGEDLPASDAAHVEGCAECHGRLEQLRTVAAAVAAHVPIPAGHVREAGVAAAMTETTGVTPAIRRITSARRARAANPPRRGA